MTIRWQQLFVSLSLWLMAEFLLNLVGVDDLVDYSEYIFDRHTLVAVRQHTSEQHALPPLFPTRPWIDA